MRTVSDLLASRRAAVAELRTECDKTARQMLEFAIQQIDRELHARARCAETLNARGGK